MDIYPGSPNLQADVDLSLRDPVFADRLLMIDATEYSGERDVLMLPCVLVSLDDTEAFIWRTTNAEEDPTSRNVLEVICDRHLRSAFGLVDGDEVTVRVSP